MDIFFQDPDEIPLPWDEVRIRDLQVEPWPDGKRVKVYLEVHPFQKRPHADVVMLNAAGEVVSQASVIEPASRKMEFNMHVREESPGGSYRLKAKLFYRDDPKEAEADEAVEMPDQRIVDEAEISFEI